MEKRKEEILLFHVQLYVRDSFNIQDHNFDSFYHPRGYQSTIYFVGWLLLLLLLPSLFSQSANTIPTRCNDSIRVRVRCMGALILVHRQLNS